MKRLPSLFILASALAACGGQTTNDTTVLPKDSVTPATPRLGAVLSTAFGGQIFGFNVDQNGADGLLTESATRGNKIKSAIETFDLKTGKITKVVKAMVSSPNDDFVTFGIVGNDVGFVDEQRVNTTKRARNDVYFLLDPVSGKKITANWRPPHVKNSVLYQQAENQGSSTQVSIVFRDAFTKDVPWVYAWDSATNKFLNFIKLAYAGEAIAEDTSTNQAVLAGQDGSGSPMIALVSLKTGKIKTFLGLNNGPYGAGGVNGMAVDSATGMACTTTEINAQVEFYDLATETGFEEQLPGTGSASELNSGTIVAFDSVHHLFLVAQPVSSEGGGSAVYVYREDGKLVDTITGFKFSNSSIPPVWIAVNPSQRIGWINGPNADNLQQFFY
jgi:hypothetical protein